MPIVTLLTDFGTADSYVAETKGALLSRAHGVMLVDVTHDVPPGDVRAAAFLLARTWHRFPAGTIHLAVVDPGVGTARAPLALEARGHRFVGPDNGLFTPVLDAPDLAAVALDEPAGAAPTFHGRDLFAPAAAALATGTPLDALGTRIERLVRLPPAVLRRDGPDLVGEVVHVDRYGTLVTNVPVGSAGEGSVVRVAGVEVGPLRRTFGDVESGALLALAGSGGTVEIAVRDGSAAARLAARVGARVELRARPR
jgi:S-adenosylmethionine hydrolase